jgi:hypothetical protein
MAYSYGYGPPQEHELAGYGGFFSKITKAVRSTVSSFDPTKKGGILNPVKALGTLIAAPLVVPTAALVKGTTWAAAQTGLKPLVKLNAAEDKVVNSKFGKAVVASFETQMIVGAAVGGAIVAAPVVSSAASAAWGTAGAAVTAAGADLAKKNLMGLVAAKPVTPTVAPLPVAGPPPAAGPSFAAILAAAGAGFLVAGPPGAVVGGGAGYVLGRK